MHLRHSPRCSRTALESRREVPPRTYGPEVLVREPAAVLVEVARVHGQEGLAQALAGAIGEGGDRVRGHPQHRCDVGRLVALDLGVPQHELPALGERGEGTRRGAALEALDSRVAERLAGVEGTDVVGGLHARAGADLVDVQPADRGEQVGAERDVRPSAALQHGEHLGEGGRHQVVSIGRRDQLAGEPARGVDVALEQVAVGRDVPTPDSRDQLGVSGALDAGQCRAHVRYDAPGGR